MIIKLIGSGGVIIADSITATIIPLRNLLKKLGVIIPIDEKRNDATGISKITPEPIINAKTKLK